MFGPYFVLFPASNLPWMCLTTFTILRYSYIDLVEAADAYTERSFFYAGAYFRYVDQSDNETQIAMKNYLEDIAAMSSVKFPPDHFWLTDFELFAENQTDSLGGLSFGEKVDRFLAVPSFFNLYSENIVQEASTRNVLVSRVYVRMDNVALDVISEQIDALKEQRDMTKRQSINEGWGGADHRFFLYEERFNQWYVVFPSCFDNTSVCRVGSPPLSLFLYRSFYEAVVNVSCGWYGITI